MVGARKVQDEPKTPYTRKYSKNFIYIVKENKNQLNGDSMVTCKKWQIGIQETLKEKLPD